MMPETETSGDDAAEEWSTPVNWEDPAIKAEQRRRRYHIEKYDIRGNKVIKYFRMICGRMSEN